MFPKILIGTEWDFRNRIPLAFYPVIFLSAVGAILNPPLPQIPALKIICLCFFILGFLLRSWGVSLLTGNIVVDADAHDEKIIDKGPFALLRHPLYTGAGLMLVSLFAFLPPLLFVTFCVYALVFGLRLALYEETLLHKKLGAAYRDYCSRTGRHVPNPFKFRLTRWRDVAHVGALKEVCLSELAFALYGVFLITAIIANNTHILYLGIIASSVISGFLVKRLAKNARI